MRNIATYLAASLRICCTLLVLSAPGCAKHSNPPPAYAPSSVQGAPVTQAPGYGDGTAPSPALATSPVGSAAPLAPLSTPNPLSPPCTADANCLTHRCNVAAQKCAWPCQTDNDC